MLYGLFSTDINVDSMLTRLHVPKDSVGHCQSSLGRSFIASEIWSMGPVTRDGSCRNIGCQKHEMQTDEASNNIFANACAFGKGGLG